MKGIIYIFLDNYVLVKTFTMEMASLLLLNTFTQHNIFAARV